MDGAVSLGHPPPYGSSEDSVGHIQPINTLKLQSRFCKGHADMVSMARRFLADPEFVNKAAAGRPETINTVSHAIKPVWTMFFQNKRASCLVNPLACHETEIDIQNTDSPKKSLSLALVLQELHLHLSPPREDIRSHCLTQPPILRQLIWPRRSQGKLSLMRQYATSSNGYWLQESNCSSP